VTSIARAGVVTFALAIAGALAAPVRAQPILAGRPLAEALRDLQRRGLAIVFSTEVVQPGMRVGAIVPSSDPRRMLEALLEPHGLEARGAPRDVLVVARKRQGATSAPRPPAAAPSGSIRGLVVDARSAATLAGVLVRIPRSGAETVSDADGHFELNAVAPGAHRLYVSLIGYVLAEPEVTVPAGAALDLTVTLSEGAATYTEEITVVGDAFRGPSVEVPAAMALNSADLRELRGVLTDDPFRAVQALPGVISGNDLRSEFAIRGSDPAHVGLSIEGITTDWPVHAVHGDWSGGSVGLVNADVVDGITLLAGAYPLEQPARSGGLLDITLREGSRARTQAHASLTMTSASLITEGPIGQAARGSWLVSARQSYVQWILERTGADGTRFAFGDVAGKLAWDVTPRQQVRVAAVAGHSLLELDRADPDPNLITRGSATASFVSGAWQSSIGAGATVVQRAALLTERFANDGPTMRDLSAGSRTDVVYRADAAVPVGGSVSARFGGEIRHETSDASFTRFIGFADGPRTERVELVDGSRNVLSAYARLSVPLHARVRLDTGALVTRAADVTAAPQAAATGSFGAWTIRGAAGLYRQPAALEQTASTFGRGGLASEWSRHLDFSVERRLGGTMRVQLAGYRRDDRNALRLAGDEFRVVGPAIVTPSLSPAWGNTLGAHAWGVEILAQRRAAAGLSGWMGYAWSRTRSSDSASGERFAADYDQPHAFNAFAQYRLSTVTAVSGKLRIGDGTPVIGYLTGTLDDAFVGSDRNRLRLPLYARLDLRVNHAFNMESRRLTLFAEVVNVFGRRNETAACACAGWTDSPQVYSDGRVTSVTQRMFPFLPTVGIVVDF
jgi:hypothetical protein